MMYPNISPYPHVKQDPRFDLPYDGPELCEELQILKEESEHLGFTPTQSDSDLEILHFVVSFEEGYQMHVEGKPVFGAGVNLDFVVAIISTFAPVSVQA